MRGTCIQTEAVNLICAPKMDLVPTPVLSPFFCPRSMMVLMRSRYWSSSWRGDSTAAGTEVGGGAVREVGSVGEDTPVITYTYICTCMSSLCST